MKNPLESIAEIVYNGKVEKMLYMSMTPISAMFTALRPSDKSVPSKEHHPNSRSDPEIFVWVKDGSYRSYYATMSPNFHRWVKENTFCYPQISVSVIRQQNSDTFLLLVEESQIIGSRWLDYKSIEEVEMWLKTSKDINTKVVV